MWYQHVLSTAVTADTTPNIDPPNPWQDHLSQWFHPARRVHVVWLEQKLKPNQRVSLKGEDKTIWNVEVVYATGSEKPPIKTWHNNI